MALLAGVLLVLNGCATTPKARATPRPTPTVSRAELCHELAGRYVDQCPPVPISFDPNVPFQNEVGGQVPHPSVLQWEQAFLRSNAYYLWAYRNGKAEFLLSGAIAPTHVSQVDLFRVELQQIASAQQAGGRLELKPLTMTTVAFVATPSALKPTAAALGTQWEPWGFITYSKGPAYEKVVLPDGHVQTLGSVGPRFTNEGITWGYFKRDPQLGLIWYQEGFIECGAGSPAIASECATLS
ncbi:MAG TPA: hypothetical protein VIA06_07690 [Candidatus Dormibacteraeota bacterium]|nr:hypothetical protein [Candidatus Dormibacteraeota bacterium]